MENPRWDKIELMQVGWGEAVTVVGLWTIELQLTSTNLCLHHNLVLLLSFPVAPSTTYRRRKRTGSQ